MPSLSALAWVRWKTVGAIRLCRTPRKAGNADAKIYDQLLAAPLPFTYPAEQDAKSIALARNHRGPGWHRIPAPQSRSPVVVFLPLPAPVVRGSLEFGQLPAPVGPLQLYARAPRLPAVWIVALIAPRLSAVWQLWLAVSIEAVWEVLENSEFVIRRYREQTAALGYHGDTIVNSLGDILVCGLGFVVAHRLGFRRTFALFVLTEVTLALWIRDNLTLNVLMLIYPIEAIKEWQAAGH